MQRLLLPSLLLMLALLAVFCTRHHAPALEAEIERGASARLAQAGLVGVTASADGRGVRLEGVAASAELRRRAEASVLPVAGISGIDNRVRVVAPETGAPETGAPETGAPETGAPAPAPTAPTTTQPVPPLEEAREPDTATPQPAAGEPPAAGAPPDDTASRRLQNELQSELDRILSGSTIEFRTSKAELTAEGRRVLDRLIEPLRRAGGFRVWVEGHTDSRGDDAKNLGLSQERARAVADYLVVAGIDASRVRAQGFGETRPIATNDTIDGRQRNRRIELRLEREN